MSGCHDKCGLCSVCALSCMEQKCDALAAERDALRARVAELEGERDRESRRADANFEDFSRMRDYAAKVLRETDQEIGRLRALLNRP